jgi:hypothetical protein
MLFYLGTVTVNIIHRSSTICYFLQFSLHQQLLVVSPDMHINYFKLCQIFAEFSKFCLNCPSCSATNYPFPLVRSYCPNPSCHVLTLQFRLFCPICPVPAVRSYCPNPSCHVLALQFRLFCPICPVPADRSQLLCPSCPVLAVRFQLFCPSCPVWDVSAVKLCRFCLHAVIFYMSMSMSCARVQVHIHVSVPAGYQCC